MVLLMCSISLFYMIVPSIIESRVSKSPATLVNCLFVSSVLNFFIMYFGAGLLGTCMFDSYIFLMS